MICPNRKLVSCFASVLDFACKKKKVTVKFSNCYFGHHLCYIISLHVRNSWFEYWALPVKTAIIVQQNKPTWRPKRCLWEKSEKREDLNRSTSIGIWSDYVYAKQKGHSSNFQYVFLLLLLLFMMTTMVPFYRMQKSKLVFGFERARLLYCTKEEQN